MEPSNVWTDGRLKALNGLLGGAIYQVAKTKGCGEIDAPYRLTQCDFNSRAAFYQRAAGFWKSAKKYSFASAICGPDGVVEKVGSEGIHILDVDEIFSKKRPRHRWDYWNQMTVKETINNVCQYVA